MPSLLTSPRFLGIFIIAVLQGLVLFNVIDSVQGEGLIVIVQSVIAGAVVVRTVDRVGDKSVLAAGVASEQITVTPVNSVTNVPPKD